MWPRVPSMRQSPQSSCRAGRSDLIDPAVDAHHGRIVKRTGDEATLSSVVRRRRTLRRHCDPDHSMHPTGSNAWFAIQNQQTARGGLQMVDEDKLNQLIGKMLGDLGGAFSDACCDLDHSVPSESGPQLPVSW
jgi:hypothetical protein